MHAQFLKTYDLISEVSLKPWLKTLPSQVDAAFKGKRWGDLPKWLETVDNLPIIKPSSVDIDSASIRIGSKKDIDQSTQTEFESQLRGLQPWRKGPFNLFGIQIDTEWRSDLKWDRLKNHIQSLENRLVLDVGCGNGYHCWRMKAQKAKLVCGLDPTLLYVTQFLAMQKYIQDPSVSVLPIGIDDMPENLNYFDTVFSMGLLYHRRAPFDHLLQLKSLLREGGELVLETLVIDGELGEVLSPAERYAKMRNVWFIPSVPTLESWLTKMQFKNVRCVDVIQTTSEEQRPTEWMDGKESLDQFLDPQDKNKTIEGYPAPKRAIFLANK